MGCWFHLESNLLKRVNKIGLRRIVDYFEKKYVGIDRANPPRFLQKILCFYDRCIQGFLRPSCHQEAWHGAFSDNIRSHPTVNELLQFLHTQQNLNDW